MIYQKKLFNIYGATGSSFAGNVYDKKYVAPTLRSHRGGNQQPLIVETMQEYDSIYYNQSPDFVRPPAQYQSLHQDGQPPGSSNS